MNDVEYIRLYGVTERNLKEIDVAIPKRRLTVVTGLSGSGKSTLLFDVLCKEAERQHLLTMGRVAEQVQRPHFREAVNLAPVVAVSQRRTNDHPRSTVGTYSEIYTHLRILYLAASVRKCGECGAGIALSDSKAHKACPECSAELTPLTLAHLSFNTPYGACETCGGLGEELIPDPDKLLDLQASITGGGMLAWKKGVGRFFETALVQAARHYGLPFEPEHMHKPIGELPAMLQELLIYGTDDERIRQLRPDVPPPKTAETGRFEGAVPAVRRRFFDNPGHVASETSDLKPLMKQQVCTSCQGTRLKADARSLTINGTSIAEACGLSLRGLGVLLEEWTDSYRGLSSFAAVQPLMYELQERVQSLADVGLSYLTLDRPMTSLSGGESQRVRLASSLHSNLTDIVFVYDEPSSGLHPKDVERLFRSLQRQRDRGNTVIVVEHQLELAALADYVIEVGPGAGRHGGQIVFQGDVSSMLSCSSSLTSRYIQAGNGAASDSEGYERSGVSEGSQRALRSERQQAQKSGWLRLTDVTQRNLKAVSAEFPLGSITAVVGVSGSGKTTLLFDELLPAIRDKRGSGSECIERIVEIDQKDMGRSSRSNAATYTGIFDAIREWFAAQARKAGFAYKASHFSFNVKGGRCENCQGHGVIKTNMYFMPDAMVACDTCRGSRYTEDILKVTYKGYSIASILEASIQEAADLFADVPSIHQRLEWLLRLGLGYLPLGQPASTLSGGEARRIQLAKELQSPVDKHTLYVLDEPSTGLHPQDTDKLGAAIDELIRLGHTVIMIEHKPLLIRRAHWIVELGPEGGERGGYLLCQGTVSQVRGHATSQIGPFL
ncbi:excinuclease ABC subunit UvrA [Paenibacillus sp. YYML68]|uniref:excinuclease ABC subunit UvrA n=1 Tax=Paenibacillus sp. YYML68 TaxID=2909250 RepID=UPI00249303E6|nr:excinuclease ABC subunit UvrA [Paenibacillus sp. YYML68]